MNDPAMTNILGARIRDTQGGEVTVLALSVAPKTLTNRMGIETAQTWVFVALCMADDKTMHVFDISGWTLVAV